MQEMIALFLLGGLLGYLIGQVATSRSLFAPLRNTLLRLIGNETLTLTFEARFLRLDPVTQGRLRKFVAVLDPITDSTPDDLDDKTVAWLKTITDGVATTIRSSSSTTVVVPQVPKEEIIPKG